MQSLRTVLKMLSTFVPLRADASMSGAENIFRAISHA
jgi:hypothetical protein